MKKSKILLFVIIIAIIISLIFIFSNLSASCESSDIVVKMQIDNPIMEVNGKKTEVDKGRSTTPVAINNRTLVPIRAIIEAFNGTVDWDNNTKTTTLTLKNDTIKLTIDKNTAYINGKKEYLDVAPTAINNRTMLPIRFIAEGFNLGVAWNNETKNITLITNTLDKNEYDYIKKNVPKYSGTAFTTLNNNKPLFKDYEIIPDSFEYYSVNDELGRCNVCFASISTDLMPTKKRESISSVKPTGWINKKYSFISGEYLYNRCHLIGFQLTGENANKRNLITGTRYLNVDGMLPYENEVAEYVKSTGNHVMYRSSPVFTDNNLVADGVLLEGYSVEDKGKGISFCVYCYNVQPNIAIDYQTGDNKNN